MKYAFVTGGNRGIGRGFVDYLYDQGYFVFGGTRKITEKNKDRLVWIEIDLTSDTSIELSGQKIREYTTSLDLLINNAGVNKDSATGSRKELVSNLTNLDRKSLLTMFEINTIAPLLLTKELLSLLKNADSFVINISSCRASYNDEYENSTANYGYRASKTALNMMTYTSTWDLPTNVKTFAVHPGSVKTDMNADGIHAPYDQAKKMLDIVKNWKDEFNGMFLRFDGSLYPL